MLNFREIVNQIKSRFARSDMINASTHISERDEPEQKIQVKCDELEKKIEVKRDDPDQKIEVYSQWIPYKKNIHIKVVSLQERIYDDEQVLSHGH